MHPLYQEFISGLDRLDKEHCLQLILSKLDKHEIDIVKLYTEVLTPAQYENLSAKMNEEDSIWEEHLRTSIIRTIIECCYPYVIKERDHKYISPLKNKAIVLCPPEELHEIGARMAADYFTLCGLNVLFIGANTPQRAILNGIKYFQPQYVCISITNYYNLVATRNAIQNIIEIKGIFPFQVILGGQACRSNPQACSQMGADLILDTFEDIQSLAKR
jgi:MerR family transcriptional regulator, light-induced transcriptional regulator